MDMPTTPAFVPRLNSTVAQKRQRSLSPELEEHTDELPEVFHEEHTDELPEVFHEEVAPLTTLQHTEEELNPQPPQEQPDHAEEESGPPLLTTPVVTTARTNVTITPPPEWTPDVPLPTRRVIAAELTLTSPPRPPPSAEPLKMRFRLNAASDWTSVNVSIDLSF